MRPSTPLTRIYRDIVVSGDYAYDFVAVADTLVERLLAGRSL